MRPQARDSVRAESVLTAAAESYATALGDRLLAAYALGSLAHGGFSPLVSDIDLGLVLSDPVLPDDAVRIQRIAEAEKAKGDGLGAGLSVFWGTGATLRGEQDGGRFPPLDRLDLLENGRLLRGTDVRQGLPRPSADELLVRGAEFALESLAGSAIEEIRHPELLLGGGLVRLTKVVLFPVRFTFTAATGRIGTNDAAVEHYLAGHDAPGRDLVRAAFGWRTAPPADNEAATELLRAQLVPLYLHYIDDHVARLDALDEAELARAFRNWRARLADDCDGQSAW